MDWNVRARLTRNNFQPVSFRDSLWILLSNSDYDVEISPKRWKSAKNDYAPFDQIGATTKHLSRYLRPEKINNVSAKLCR